MGEQVPELGEEVALALLDTEKLGKLPDHDRERQADDEAPVVGLYAATPALLLYALFRSSHHLVVGPRSATAALSAGAVASLAGADSFLALSAGLALAVGVLALGAGLLRLGFLASFISAPVLKG
jgi:MFS superfamily sulfate permease-like transporter